MSLHIEKFPIFYAQASQARNLVHNFIASENLTTLPKKFFETGIPPLPPPPPGLDPPLVTFLYPICTI